MAKKKILSVFDSNIKQTLPEWKVEENLLIEDAKTSNPIKKRKYPRIEGW